MAYNSKKRRVMDESRSTPWAESWPTQQGEILPEVNPLAGILASGLNNVERRLDGSAMGLLWPNTMDDVFRQYQFGQSPRAEDIGQSFLEVGLPGGVLGGMRKAGQTAVGRSMVARHGTEESRRIYDKEIAHKEPTQQARHWLFRDKEALQASPDFEPRPVSEIQDMQGKLDYMHDNAIRLGWADDGLEGAATPVAAGETPKAIFVTGPAAAGKSSIANPIARQYNAAIPDPDEAKKILPDYHGGLGANAVHDQSKHLHAGAQDRLVQERYNLVIPTVGGNPAKLQKKAEDLRKAGYEVQLLNMDVPPEAAKGRMLRRSAYTGRHIPMHVFAPDAEAAGKSFGVLKANKNNTYDGIAQVDNHTVGRGEDRPILMDTAGLLAHIVGFR